MSKHDSLRLAITEAYRRDETLAVEQLLKDCSFPSEVVSRIQDTARKLVIETREQRKKQSSIEKLLHQYDLSTEAGIALMCLAEALMRVPDQHTRDLLISDKLAAADWLGHKTQEGGFFANAANWSLALTGKIFSPSAETDKSFFGALKRTISSPGLLAIRPVINQGMKMLGSQFVTGQTIEEALKNAGAVEKDGYRFSYDMLGEAARTQEDAKKYYQAYEKAIIALAEATPHRDPIQSSSISIKLSALHPRYEYNQRELMMKDLLPALLQLVLLAKEYNLGVTIDAEEADRLDLMLDLFEALFALPELAPWEGLGIVVQAYQKRAPYVIDWLAALSKKHQRRIPLRLVKGAYWDSEIKISQVMGFEGYPVFTRKHSTDLSYIVCAKKIFDYGACFYPQFGTHNALTVATILALAGENKAFEFQCLHGMGRPLYNQVVDRAGYNRPVRIYAPVGSHQDLVGYLVRRLLENGANSSFINQISHDDTSLERLLTDPYNRLKACASKPHPHIPLPQKIYKDRENSLGPDLSNRETFAKLQASLEKNAKKLWVGTSLIKGKPLKNDEMKPLFSPSNPEDRVGETYKAGSAEIEDALKAAVSAKETWGQTTIEQRSAYLEEAAALFQAEMPNLLSLLSREGGKALPDCISEIRETIDYCRYYALQARKECAPRTLQGPTGEANVFSLHPRGTLLCISPWNFPLAIFTGQIVAGLAAGNCVIAKPAEQTPLIATEAVRLLHKAGIPTDALQLLTGKGSVIGPTLVADPRIDGVMFTGSTETAAAINQSLAARPGPIVPLIAETGGQNAMIVDSSALPEQVVADVLLSAFNSAGQRCSALRVLFVQEELAPRLLPMLKGAMEELKIGSPQLLNTDLGPVIDPGALAGLQKHVDFLKQEAEFLAEVPLPPELKGTYFAPCAFVLKDLSSLTREVFGPILHVLTFAAKDLDKVLEAVRRTGYGLTLGIHSRIETTIDYITKQMPVGNMYVNRNMIGAVVGVQPFGGERLSGTGPKAGGPHYLPRLCVERSVSTNTTAVGGNTTLVTLDEDEPCNN